MGRLSSWRRSVLAAPGVAASFLVAGLLVLLLAACDSAAPGPAAASSGQVSGSAGAGTMTPLGSGAAGSNSAAAIGPASSATPPASTAGPTATTPGAGTNGATPAPSWLGHRVLRRGPDGYGIAGATPRELRNRRIVSTDLLPPPADGRFHATITAVPVRVLDRSTWSAGCPVGAGQLRYVTVSFRGFDGRAHTGELLLNRSAASGVVTVFRKLFAAAWPIEEMRITSEADLNAAPTGDGNDTSAFVCRPVRGASVWSQHAYGLAIDVNPFDNPSVQGRTVLPELAKWYTDRARGAAGMNTPNSLPVRAFRSIGWGWGGNFRTKKDWMHFSANGG